MCITWYDKYLLVSSSSLNFYLRTKNDSCQFEKWVLLFLDILHLSSHEYVISVPFSLNWCNLVQGETHKSGSWYDVDISKYRWISAKKKKGMEKNPLTLPVIQSFFKPILELGYN